MRSFVILEVKHDESLNNFNGIVNDMATVDADYYNGTVVATHVLYDVPGSTVFELDFPSVEDLHTLNAATRKA